MSLHTAPRCACLVAAERAISPWASIKYTLLLLHCLFLEFHCFFVFLFVMFVPFSLLVVGLCRKKTDLTTLLTYEKIQEVSKAKKENKTKKGKKV